MRHYHVFKVTNQSTEIIKSTTRLREAQQAARRTIKDKVIACDEIQAARDDEMGDTCFYVQIDMVDTKNNINASIYETEKVYE